MPAINVKDMPAINVKALVTKESNVFILAKNIKHDVGVQDIPQEY